MEHRAETNKDNRKNTATEPRTGRKILTDMLTEQRTGREALADTPMGIRVRKMTPADIPAVAALERVCFTMPWSESGFDMALKQADNLFLVGESDAGEIVAYCGLYVMADEGEITNVAVAKRCRGQGIGSRVLAELLRQADRRGIARIYLEVRESNTPAQRLYEKMDFSGCGLRKNFYEFPREDAIVMCRQRALP